MNYDSDGVIYRVRARVGERDREQTFKTLSCLNLIWLAQKIRG